MDSWDKFEETYLPPSNSFYSKLSMSGVNDGDYEHAHRVWRDFRIKNMGEYHDLYLKTVVILLANVLEEFRRVCMENYGSDPAHFLMAPGLAWKACLKKTKICLELLLDPDMLQMFERGLEEESLNLLIDGLLQTILTWDWNIIPIDLLSTYNTWTLTTYMDGQRPNHYLRGDLDG